MPGPAFIGAGFSRCGTTSLYQYFREHPDMWMPPLKEICYWDVERYQGMRNPKRKARLRFAAHSVRHPSLGRSTQLDDARFLVRYALLPPNDERYRKLFAPAGSRRTGELSPPYMRLTDEQVDALHRALPDVRIIFMLRDPVERGWSNAKKALARTSGTSIDEVPDADIEAFFTSPNFRANSDYVGTIRRWRARFDQDQLFIGFTSDLEQRPATFLTDLAAFIDVDPAPLIESQERRPRHFSMESYGGSVPPRWERFLAEQFRPMVADLAGEVPGEPAAWLDRIDTALAPAAGPAEQAPTGPGRDASPTR